METKYLKINPADNVVVAISDLKAGEAITVDGHAITLKEDVPAGHKVTLKDFAQGENIIKYGYPIGHAVTAVEQGRWINETQIKTNLAGLLDYTYNPVSVDLNIPKKDLTFKGYRRKNGDVGIRNEVWIIPTVGCVNGIIGQLAVRVGLKCGGSDGFSGITANPLLGMFSDFLIAQGGTSVLTEVPEMFGAETILMNRCRTKELFEQTVHLINDFKEYFLSHGEPVGENPSPGNKAGGISTLEDKALGCTQKCGKAYVDGVMGYGDRLKVKGLNLLSAPGNDLVAATALASCGCHMVLFTTGRGTPFGTFVPTMKISTNSTLAKNKPGWIDFNAGVIVENEPMEKTCERFIDYIIRVASGEPVNNEKKNYREIAIFKTGVTL